MSDGRGNIIYFFEPENLSMHTEDLFSSDEFVHEKMAYMVQL